MKYLLRTPHVIEGGLRNAGTVVGDDPDCAVRFYGDPTPDMVGLNPESEAKVNEVHNRLYGNNAPWHADPKADDPRFRPPAVEEPALVQDREHFGLSPEERGEAEEAAAKEMAEANQAHYEQHAMPPTSLPHPVVAGVGTFVMPATVDTPQDQVQRPTVPLRETLPTEAAIPAPKTPPPPSRASDKKDDN